MTARIRACVMDSDYDRFFTWYDDGTVVTSRRSLDYVVTERGIDTLEEFNQLLLDMNVAPLKSKRVIQREMKLPDPELEKIPF